MTLAIVAYPDVSADDRHWIEEIRRVHDPQSTLIAAHFTLVFPVDVRSDELVEHARSVVSDFQDISFVLRSVRAVRSVVGQGAHVFLVPAHGATEIIELHDRLYRGFLKPYLRTDIPFIPHITVAAHRDVSECERLATRLGEQRREISGEIRGFDVVAGEAEARSMAHVTFKQ